MQAQWGEKIRNSVRSPHIMCRIYREYVVQLYVHSVSIQQRWNQQRPAGPYTANQERGMISAQLLLPAFCAVGVVCSSSSTNEVPAVFYHQSWAWQMPIVLGVANACGLLSSALDGCRRNSEPPIWRQTLRITLWWCSLCGVMDGPRPRYRSASFSASLHALYWTFRDGIWSSSSLRDLDLAPWGRS
jgi:hypothetical protein